MNAAERNPLEMKTLSGLTGTGITLLEAFIATAGQRNISSAQQEKLRVLCEEYKKLFEDIELFSDDISAADCFRAAIAGTAFSDLNTPEEDAAWRDL
jgi:cell division protein FtsB